MVEEKVKTTTKKSQPKVVKAKTVKSKTVVASEKNEATVKVAEKKEHGLKLDVINTAGEKDGTITLPENIFGVKINPQLIAQAVRVYLVNQRRGTASTKTRGEVDGTTRKIYRQKGTGRARHGGIRAPIFVKGGIAHGPKPKNYELKMPANMKKAAFLSALSSKVKSGEIKIVTGVEALETKTKAFARAFDAWGLVKKGRNVLLVLPQDAKNIYQSARNLAGVTITTAGRLHTYEILQHKVVILMKDTVKTLEEKVKKHE